MVTNIGITIGGTKPMNIKDNGQISLVMVHREDKRVRAERLIPHGYLGLGMLTMIVKECILKLKISARFLGKGDEMQ